MEFLERSRNLLENLKRAARNLGYVHDDLKTATDDELEALYDQEFDLAMEMTDIYETLVLNLNKLEENEDHKFIASRLRAQAESIIGAHSEYDIRRDN